MPRPENYSFISQYWLEKWEEKPGEKGEPQFEAEPWEWSLQQSKLTHSLTGNVRDLRASGKEGQLIRALMRGKKTKTFLLDLLWPEQNDPTDLSNRFHALVSRINKRLDGLILFDGQNYCLSRKIHIK
jgi:hypothetical protein